MTFLKTFAFASLAAAGLATTADAQAFDAPVPPAPVQLIPVGNGYGPTPYGIYGHRSRFRANRSYGTGYHGRGTRTGGPSGGLPGRS